MGSVSKFYLTTIFLLFFISCSSNKKTKNSILLEKKDTIHNEYSDCTFDQQNQTEDFIKKIKELKNYSWNSKNKTATIKITSDETLKIHRGGCNHFLLSAEFILPKNFTLKKDKKYIFSKLIWVSKLIYNKHDYKIIKESIENNRITLDSPNKKKGHVNFLNKEIYNNYTIFYDEEQLNKNVFSIEYYIN